MVDWVTRDVGITDSVEGKSIAEQVPRGSKLAVINVVAEGVNPAADFQHPMLQPQFSVEYMDEIAALIERLVVTQYSVVVHCGAGVERSPLAVAWWLHRRRGLNLDQAYAQIQAARPEAQDRRTWIAGQRHRTE